MNKTSPLLQILEKFPRKKICIWGDYILDEYVYGITRRISREAPVLILSYQENRYSLGGAGNSVLNLKSLGAEPHPVGVTGDDHAGETVRQMMKERKISSDSIFSASGFRTPTKMRILAGERGTRKQQILRIDKEEKVPLHPDLQNRLKNSLIREAVNSDALIISDYNYLTVREELYREVLPVFQKKEIPVSLDSRFRLLRFPRPTVCTPNETEAAAALYRKEMGTGAELERTGSLLLKKSGAEFMVLTRGCRGMTVFEKNKPPVHIPVFGSTDIVDVTGAGDAVISVFTLALTAGADTLQAARLANCAGGLAVMKEGTAVISLPELKEAVSSQA